VPFVHKPPNPDRTLEQKLRAEWPAILRWMIDGCLAWQESGLVRPKVVLDATAEYFSEQDSIRQWIGECCDIGGPNAFETTATLFKSWSEYAQANGEKPGTTKWFTQALIRQGCEPIKNTPG
jgi:putative DNA primase/helicase